MTDEPKTPGSLTPHITEFLDPCRCPSCGSYSTECVAEECPTLYGGVPAANERWHCHQCSRDHLAIYEGHIHAILWLDADGSPQVQIQAESPKKQLAEELYERLSVLSAVARRLNDQQHAGIKIDAGDWSLLYSITNGARGLIDRIKKLTLG